MAERGTNIDIFFRNGLKEYEVLPPPEVWEGIRPALKKRRQSAVLLRVAASVAVLVSLGASTLFLVNKLSSGVSNPSLTLNRENMQEAILPAVNNTFENVLTEEANIVTVSAPDSDVDQAVPADVNYSLPEPSLFKSFLEKNKINSMGPDPLRQPGKTVPVTGDLSGRNLPDGADKEVKYDNPGSLGTNKWSIGAMVSPNYYSSINFGNDPAAESLVRSEEAIVSYSGGFSFAYRINRRLSVQTGIYYASMGQEVTGVDSYTGFNKHNEAKGNGQFMVQTSSGMITTGNSDIYLGEYTGTRVITAYTRDVFDPVKSSLSYIDNSIHQNFNYIEIPFVMRYKLLDRKIDFNLAGGISYNLLLSNSAYAFSDGGKYFVGTTEGLSPVTFSSSLGMGLEYNFSERMSLNLEPTFRYYMTPIGGFVSTSIHPYSFGVLSGISYKF